MIQKYIFFIALSTGFICSASVPMEVDENFPHNASKSKTSTRRPKRHSADHHERTESPQVRLIHTLHDRFKRLLETKHSSNHHEKCMNFLLDCTKIVHAYEAFSGEESHEAFVYAQARLMQRVIITQYNPYKS